MSVYLADSADSDPAFWCSNTGHADFCRWVDGLDAEQSPRLAHLRQYGWVEPADAVAKELAAAVRSHPPGDVKGLDAVLSSLLRFLSGLGDSPVVVSGGIRAGNPD